MQLDPIRITMRQRTPWQAIELGLVMARNFSTTLYLSYIFAFSLVAVPVVVLLHAHPLWAAFIIWYLKPLYEVGALKLLSRQVFGEQFKPHQIFTGTLTEMRQLFFSCLFSLRFSPRRSFIMPVFSLEHLDRSQRHSRVTILSRGQNQGPVALTLIWAHAEVLISYALIYTINIALPDYAQFDWFSLLRPNHTPDMFLYWLANATWFMAIIFLAPFYVGAGFSIYLNKRVELEGWDIELSFRRLKQRLRSQRGTIAGLFITLTVGLIYPATPLKAASHSVHLESVTAPTSGNNTVQKTRIFTPAVPSSGTAKKNIHEKTRTEIQQILAQAPLVNSISGYTYKWHPDPDRKDHKKAGKKLTTGRSTFADSAFLNAVAGTIEIVIWVVAIGAIAFILFILFKTARGVQPAKRIPRPQKPSATLGVVFDKEPLNTDLNQRLQHYLKRHDLRRALALLLGTALAEIQQQHPLSLSAGFTEDDCLNQCRILDLGQAWQKWMANLVETWTQLAWGHRPITLAQVQALIDNAPLNALGRLSAATPAVPPG